MIVIRQGSSLCAATLSAVVAVAINGCDSNQDRSDGAARADAHDHHDRAQRIRPNEGPDSDLPNELRRSFFRAAARGDVQTAKQLLERQPLSVDARPDNEHRIPLISATWVEMVKLLIAHGADREAEDYVWGGNALGWSGWFGRPSVASVLIEAGAEINHPNRGRCTPLCSASSAQAHKPDQGDRQATPADRVAVIELLKKHGGGPQQDRTRPWPIIEGWKDHPD
jgi:hypothetical protein